jgi:hypothetical protein
VTLVPNWRRLWRAWSVRFAAIGIIVPELLQLIADNADSLGWLKDWTGTVRLVCLVLVLLLRPVKQEAVSAPKG